MATNLISDTLERAALGRRVCIGSLYNIKDDTLIYDVKKREKFNASLFKDQGQVKRYIKTSEEMNFCKTDFNLEEMFSKRIELLHITDDQRIGLQLDLHEPLSPEYDNLIKWRRSTNRVLRGTLVHTRFSSKEELHSTKCLNKDNLIMNARSGFVSSSTHVVYGITWGERVIFSFDCPIPFENERKEIEREFYNAMNDIVAMIKKNNISKPHLEKHDHLNIKTELHGFANGLFDDWKIFVQDFPEILSNFSQIGDRPLAMTLYPLSKIACLRADKAELFHSIRRAELLLFEEHFHNINQARCHFMDFYEDLSKNAESIVRPNTSQMSEIKKMVKEIETKVNKQKKDLKVILKSHRNKNMKGFGMYKQVLQDMNNNFSYKSIKVILEKFEQYIDSHKYLAELKFRKCGIITDTSELNYNVNHAQEVYVFNYYPSVKGIFKSLVWKENYRGFLKIIEMINFLSKSSTRTYVKELNFTRVEGIGKIITFGFYSKKPAFISHYISGTIVSTDCLKDPDEHYLRDISEFKMKLSTSSQSGSLFKKQEGVIQFKQESMESEASQSNQHGHLKDIVVDMQFSDHKTSQNLATDACSPNIFSTDSTDEFNFPVNNSSIKTKPDGKNTCEELETLKTSSLKLTLSVKKSSRQSLETHFERETLTVADEIEFKPDLADLEVSYDSNLFNSSNQEDLGCNLDYVNREHLKEKRNIEDNYEISALNIDEVSNDDTRSGDINHPQITPVLESDASEFCNSNESAQKSPSEESDSESAANTAFIEASSDKESDVQNMKGSKKRKGSKNKGKKNKISKPQLRAEENVESKNVKPESYSTSNIKSFVSEEIKYLAQFNDEKPEVEFKEDSDVTCTVKCNQEFQAGSELSEEYLQRFPLLKMVCPSHLYGHCKYGEILTWQCPVCHSEMRYGLDKYIYCVMCGKAPAINFSFKCSHVTHGEEFFTFPKEDDLLGILEKLGNREELNILILGETGVGKTTFINAFANYLTYETLSEAKTSELIGLIPSTFTLSDENYEEITVKFGQTDINESEEEGASKTQTCKCYSFPCGDKMVKLIDTPGIGDTKGIDQDAKNFVNILSFISNFSNIHGILLLLKPNNSRLNIFFRFCIQELLKHLHKSASENINFVFTNSKSTFYRPGDTFPPLKKLIGELKDINIPLNQNTIYCLDNDSFRYLVASHNNVNFNDADLKEYTTSWVKSAKECERLLNRISQLKPHSVKETLSINGARRLIVSLARPLGDIIILIHENLFFINKQTQSLNAGKNKLEKLQNFLFVPVIDTEMVYFNSPRTVCSSYGCLKTSTDGVQNEAVCHDPCHLTGTTPNIVENEKLLGCVVFQDGICKNCGCSWKKHMHIYYEIRKSYTKKMDSSTNNDLKNWSTRQEKTEEVKEALEEQRKSYLKELDYVIKASATFTYFIAKNSITEQCDFILNYLLSLIDQEKSKQVALGYDKVNKGFAEELEKVINAYVRQLDKMKRDDIDVTAQEIDVHVNMLYDLPIVGAKFKDIAFRHEEALSRDVALYSEHVYIPRNSGRTKRFQFTS